MVSACSAGHKIMWYVIPTVNVCSVLRFSALAQLDFGFSALQSNGSRTSRSVSIHKVLWFRPTCGPCQVDQLPG